MKYLLQGVLIILLIFSIGCAKTVSLIPQGSGENIPPHTYRGYWYASGMGDYNRAVFLVRPDSSVEVIPYTNGILMESGSPSSALSFMQEKRAERSIVVSGVRYQDKIIGYLFTYGGGGSLISSSVAFTTLEVNIFERGGSIYFSVTENIRHDE